MSAVPPNGPMQVVFSFDTTGSMSGALIEVRGRLSDMLQRLQTDIPSVTTAVVAHGDYCDKNSTYITKHVDFTDNLPELVNFVKDVGSTYGGDEPEAYEVMLRLVRQDLSWSPGSQRALVVIGDAFPHAHDDPQNKDKIDWRQETQLLHDMGVRIYGVQVNETDKSTEFFRTMTEATEGQHLKLSQFGTLCDVIMAICYREKGTEFLQNYEAEVRAREGRLALHKDLEGVFGALRRDHSSLSGTGPAPPAPTASGMTTAPTVTRLTKAPSASKLKRAASFSKTVATSKRGAVKKAVGVTGAKTPVPRSARTTATTGKSKAVSRVSVTIPRKLKRERVPDSNFRLGRLCWSPWKLAAVPAEAEVRSGQWRRFLKGCARARRGAVVEGGSSSAGGRKSGVVCEAAVQTRPGARRHVVWSRVLAASSARRLSLSRLLSSPGVRAQLERVMRGGCRVWVRWAGLRRSEKKEEVKQEMMEVYDYAWCPSKAGFRDLWVPASRHCLPPHTTQIAGTVAST